MESDMEGELLEATQWIEFEDKHSPKKQRLKKLKTINKTQDRITSTEDRKGRIQPD